MLKGAGSEYTRSKSGEYNALVCVVSMYVLDVYAAIAFSTHAALGRRQILDSARTSVFTPPLLHVTWRPNF